MGVEASDDGLEPEQALAHGWLRRGANGSGWRQQARWIQAHGRLQLVASGSGAVWWRSTGWPWELRQDAQVARA
jgi:hypothetical protein